MLVMTSTTVLTLASPRGRVSIVAKKGNLAMLLLLILGY